MPTQPVPRASSSPAPGSTRRPRSSPGRILSTAFTLNSIETWASLRGVHGGYLSALAVRAAEAAAPGRGGTHGGHILPAPGRDRSGRHRRRRVACRPIVHHPRLIAPSARPPDHHDTGHRARCSTRSRLGQSAHRSAGRDLGGNPIHSAAVDSALRAGRVPHRSGNDPGRKRGATR